MVEQAISTSEPFDPSPAITRSVQQVADGTGVRGDAHGMLLWAVAATGDSVTPWGTLPKLRDKELRAFWPSETFLASALATVVARNAGMGWRLKGPERSVGIYQNILVNSEYGRGWGHLWTKLSIDIYSQDSGAFIQIIRLNNDDPTSPVVNLTHLDAGRVYPTGSPDTPYAYLDRKNKWHMLRWWQCRNLMELPAPIEHVQGGTLFELQYCAVSRVIRAAQILKNIAIYKDEKTAGRFMRAIHIVGGVSRQELQDAIDAQKLHADQAGLLRYVQPLIASTLDPNARVSATTIELASLPEGWDEEKTNKAYIMALAMGFLTDYQEFAPLPGGGLGTSAQSEVLHMKAKGKGPALFQQVVTHFMNFGGVLPANVTFLFDEQDTEEDRSLAEVAGIRATTRAAMIASTEIDSQAARQLAVEQGDLTPEMAAELDQREAEQKVEQERQMEAQQLQAQQSAPSSAPGDERSRNTGVNPSGVATSDGQKMVAALIDIIAGGLKDDQYRVTLAEFLQTRIHRAFTTSADDLAALGYMDTAGRIALSGLIGDLLREFADSCGSEELYSVTSVTLAEDHVEDLIKAVAKAIQPGRQKAEDEVERTVQDQFDDIFAKLAEKLAAQRDKAMVYTEPKPRKKRTRQTTKVIRGADGRIAETVTSTEER